LVFFDMQKLLVIEDSKLLRLTYGRALARAGYEILNAADGLEGLESARQNLPDLILLDILLPKMSGLEVLRALKQDASTSSIPVIVMSALSEKNKEKLMTEGAHAFVEKTEALLANNSAALLQSVAEVLEKHRARP
jgi:CheY-like chemotaxis protein